MSIALRVLLNGQHCGTVTQDDRGDTRFRYEPDYQDDANSSGGSGGRTVTPLSLSMPLVLTEHRKRVVLPFLDGLLPDSAEARRAIAERFGVNPANPVAILRHVGSDVAGALQFVAEGDDPPEVAIERPEYRALSTVDVGVLLRQAIERYASGRLFGDPESVGRFSLAGAQPKVALARTSDGPWTMPSGSAASTHILKPAVGGYRRLDVVEHLTLRTAALLGVDVAESSLEEIDGLPVFVTRRFDRVVSGDVVTRLHQEDLGQALAVPPLKKYQRTDGGPGVADVARLLRGLPRPHDRAEAAWAFYRGLLVNTVLACTDAHIKNYSVLLDGDQVSLAPLYDMASFAPYAQPGQAVLSAMKIGGEYRFDAIGEVQCLAAARTLGVDAGRAAEFVRHLRSHAADAAATARGELVSADSETRAVADEFVTSVAALPLVRGEG